MEERMNGREGGGRYEGRKESMENKEVSKEKEERKERMHKCTKRKGWKGGRKEGWIR